MLVHRGLVTGQHHLDQYILVADYADAARFLLDAPLPGPTAADGLAGSEPWGGRTKRRQADNRAPGTAADHAQHGPHR